jgi:formate hydrogenlyase subunit 3/multisubunit Na+/H+ antiporter MnhD subunit
VTPIPGPIILLAFPLAASIVVYLIRRWAFLAAFLSAATTASLAFLCLRLPLDRAAFVLGQEVAFGRPIVIVGRTLVLDLAGQAWLAFVFVLATIYYLFAWRMSQGRSFFPFSLSILSLYALTTMIGTFSLAVLVFAISVTLAVFIAQGGQRISVQGAQRYLLVTLLAVPLLLVAAWQLDQAQAGYPSGVPEYPSGVPEYPSGVDPLQVGEGSPASLAYLSTPQTEPSGAPQEASGRGPRALLPAALGFGLLLAIFPFGTWMPALAADAPPIVTAFVFTAGQSMALFLLVSFLRNAPGVLEDPTAISAIQAAALVTAASGGLIAAVQRDFGRLLGYAAMSDLGYLLLGLVTAGSQSLTLVFLHVINRAAAITLMATALAILRHRATTDRFDGLRGMAHRLPITAAGLALGGLALAGFPFTAGFPTRWAVGRAVWNWAQPALVGGAVGDKAWAAGMILAALVLSSAGILIGILRGLSAMLGPIPDESVAGQPRIASLMVVALCLLTLTLGAYPQLWLGPVQTVAQTLSLF